MAAKSELKTRPRQSHNYKPRQSKTAVKRERRNERLVEDILGIALCALALVLWAGLFAGSSAGTAGEWLAQILKLGFGVGSYLLPAGLLYTGVVLVIGKNMTTRLEIGLGGLLISIASISLLHYHFTDATNQFDVDHLTRYGGYVGAGINSVLRGYLGVGSVFIYLMVILASIVWIVDLRLLHIFNKTAETGKMVAVPVANGYRILKESRAARLKAKLDRLAEDSQDDDDYDDSEDEDTDPASSRFVKPKLRLVPAPEFSASNDRIVDDVIALDPPASHQPFSPVIGRSPKLNPAQPTLNWDRLGEVVDHVNKDYKLPSVDLLNQSPPPPSALESLVAEKQAILMQCLNDFKVGANVQRVAIGPSVTRYEVQLEPGILVKKIVALADNLAMSLSAIDVRVEAPIPGKCAIGIEVPNEITQMVTIRECLETTEFTNAPSKLTFALGKDVTGKHMYADLTKMPHLLVGGSTNSGKSVCLNTIITSIVYRATPREVKFVMIDPKKVELSLYDGIPHLLSPVVKDTRMAAGILRSVLKEMDKRYELFARIGTRNLDGYNTKVTVEEKLPYIVVIIDELADLMMSQGQEVEASICRLAALARATGIHLILATQRPSVDVITGTMKANIASRIAFMVATQVDSRTILDMPGADRLIGRGDMLFLPIDASKPIRVQGCFVSEKETDDLVTYLKSQEEANYQMIPTDNSSGYGDGDDFEDDGAGDELYEPCVRWVVNQGEASTSSLQRKFKIGYTRAARIVDTMEAKGIVGPMDGVKRREVMLEPENLELFFRGKGQGIVEGMND